MFSYLKEDRAAEYHKQCLRQIWQQREHGEWIDRYNIAHRYNALWRYEGVGRNQPIPRDLFYMLQARYPIFRFQRGFWCGPFRKYEAKHLNRKSRRETKVALRKGTLQDANQHEYWLPWLD